MAADVLLQKTQALRSDFAKEGELISQLAREGHMDALAEPTLAQWIKFAREAQTQVDKRGVEPAKRHRAIVEQNILLQMEHAANYPAVYKALQENRLELHGWLYDMHEPAVYALDRETRKFESA